MKSRVTRIPLIDLELFGYRDGRPLYRSKGLGKVLTDALAAHRDSNSDPKGEKPSGFEGDASQSGDSVAGASPNLPKPPNSPTQPNNPNNPNNPNPGDPNHAR
jgi:hypothetical protein